MNLLLPGRPTSYLLLVKVENESLKTTPTTLNRPLSLKLKILSDEELPLDLPIIIPRGKRRFTDQVVTLSESGGLTVDGEIKGQWGF